MKNLTGPAAHQLLQSSHPDMAQEMVSGTELFNMNLEDRFPNASGVATMRRWGLAIMMCTVLALPRLTSTVEAKVDNTPRLSGAVLLIGYPPAELTLNTYENASKIQNEGGDWLVTPSMSADGSVIASARRVAGDPPTGRPRLVASTYSVTEKIWKEHKNLEIFDGPVAISPDGSKLTAIVRQRGNRFSRLCILDLKTGNISTGPELSESGGPQITWSPDGRRIAFDSEVEQPSGSAISPQYRAVYVLDVEAKTVSKIADGAAPSWSPEGDWIAFFDDYTNRGSYSKTGWYSGSATCVRLIRPDGTDSKVLVTFRRSESLKALPVWSPDAKAILINKSRDEEKATVDIYLLELSTLKLTKKFGNTQPVYAWVNAK